MKARRGVSDLPDGILISGLSMLIKPEISPAAPSQLPAFGSAANAAGPFRPPGRSLFFTQSNIGQPEKTPWLVSVQPSRPFSKSSVKTGLGLPVLHSAGGFCCKTGWKLHCAEGLVRNSTAAII